MSDHPTIAEIIDSFPGENGWWKESTRDAFLDIAERMEKAGWTYELIEELLGNVYRAMREEYGE